MNSNYKTNLWNYIVLFGKYSRNFKLTSWQQRCNQVNFGSWQQFIVRNISDFPLRHGRWDSALHRKRSLTLGENLQIPSRTKAATSRGRAKKWTPTGAGSALFDLALPSQHIYPPSQCWPKNQPQHTPPLTHAALKGRGRERGLFRKGKWGGKRWESRLTQAKGLNKKMYLEWSYVKDILLRGEKEAAGILSREDSSLLLSFKC